MQVYTFFLKAHILAGQARPNGKNVTDFIDPDIAEKLEALEREEEKLEAEGFYDSEEDMVRFSPCRTGATATCSYRLFLSSVQFGRRARSS